MTTITIQKEKLSKVLEDVEVLIQDVSELVDQNMLVKQRIANIQKSPEAYKTEEELDTYLKKRGVNIE
ncbi:hypothetical protein COV18_01395 [Candidatus Woesearchaeota archaeon CG10_big_fil_rev_8_21_14_0_10_37_12]|nr:MAG: hypothetical protein COV18_01395 [Candidatus Woesearchaeota archaeon CG10_big_fil_rev_8_21_14_0_10_37_12]